MAKTLQDFPVEQVALGRERVEKGAAFFNEHFPGWQERITEAGAMLYMESMDWCAAGLAARERIAPSGAYLFTHGDVGREYKGFGPIPMGCRGDSLVSCEVLALCWLEAANTIAPFERKEGWFAAFRNRRRLEFFRQIYGEHVQLAY